MIVFEKPGKDNTQRTLEIAYKRALSMNAPLLVATTTGACAMAALEYLREKGDAERLVIVSHAYGTRAPGVNAMGEERRLQLLSEGAKVVTAAHALSGAERGISTKFHGAYPVEIIAHSLRMFSQGVKVVVEIGAMALDAGMIHYGKPVVAVGGTGSGADTAAVLTPAYSQDIFATRIHELLCMPY